MLGESGWQNKGEARRAACSVGCACISGYERIRGFIISISVLDVVIVAEGCGLVSDCDFEPPKILLLCGFGGQAHKRNDIQASHIYIER
jgi:hypothetical protein